MRYAVKRVAVRDMNRAREVEISPDMLTNDWRDLVNDPDIDIIVELIGGTTEAYDLEPVNLGTRTGFCDIAATIAELFGISMDTPGKSFADDIY